MATATAQARTLVSRAVIWAGLAVGTCLTVLAVMHGIRVPRLEVVLSVLATWALLTVLAVVAVELLRRHHRAIGTTASGGARRCRPPGTRSGARSATAWLVAKAAPRWENREHRPLMFRKVREDEETGTRRLDGKPETDADKRFFDLRESGYTGPVNQDGYAVPDAPPPEHTDTDGGTTSMTVSKIAPERRARRTAAQDRRQHPVRVGAGGRPGRRLRARIRRPPARLDGRAGHRAWPPTPRP